MTRLTADWLFEPAPQAVFAALGEAYFVGGCVRNALLDVPVTDVDIATPLVPDQVAARLRDAGIKTIPTGLKHGTQTAVIDGQPVEITTFRADIETDGRHAIVNFTTDMAVDAARRDFTMNALYATGDGELVDPLGGLQDLRDRRLRFIGAPEDRIREDYLRILRFFRFHAWYGGDGLDADGLAACAELVDGIDGLARERIGWEIRKLLSARDPAPATAAMASSGVLMRCLRGADAALLAPLVHIEGECGFDPNWQTRLAALGGEDFATQLRLSRAEQTAMDRIADAMGASGTIMETSYRHGAAATVSARLVQAAATATAPPEDLRDQAASGAARKFPLKAGDLMRAGWEAGPDLGAALGDAEECWIQSGFLMDKTSLINQLKLSR